MVVEDRVVLDRDLRCVGPAIVLRNPRTVVQLNGHTIESSERCRDGNAGAGVVVQASADRAQILGPGVIRGFQYGITIDGTGQAQVRDVRISDNCNVGIAVRNGNGIRARDLVLDRNGGGDAAGAIRIDGAQRFVLAESQVFLNDPGDGTATVDLHACVGCRVAGNRIVANQGSGIKLDVDSQGSELERNLIVGNRPYDVVDQGSDNVFVLNGFERGNGVDPPAVWPLLGVPTSPAPGVAGCGTLHTTVGPRASATIACPQDAGLRALRNTVVAYRLLNSFDTTLLFSGSCTPAVVQPAGASSGGAVTCTNPDSIWTAILEVTCCLN
jgi:hypothetical protein